MNTSLADILYLEDHEDTVELVTLVLTRNNYKVVAARNYQDALLLARTRPFDLYLVDNWVVGGSGIDLCKKLRTIDPVTPILFYSAAAYEYDREEAFAAGADGYIIKPALNDQLLSEVSRLICVARQKYSGNRIAKVSEAHAI